MVTGASTADCAVILIDARKGVLQQTRRHSWLVHLLGIRHVVLAVNKMDLVGYDQAIFDQILADYRAFASGIGITAFTAIPISGFKGDNITLAPSENTPWYSGPALIQHLETIEVDAAAAQGAPFRMPVQWVNRPNLDFRGFAGQIASGTIRAGDAVRIVPSGKTSTVKTITTFDGDLDEAVAGQSVTLTLADEVDCSRGDLIAGGGRSAAGIRSVLGHLRVDGRGRAFKPGRGYWLKLGTQIVTATVQPPKYEIDVNSLEHLAAKTLGLNSIGVAEFATDKPIAFEPYADNRQLGGFILIDKFTNATVAAGMIAFSLRRADNVHWQPTAITREDHAGLKNQTPRVLWFTACRAVANRPSPTRSKSSST